MNLVAKQMADRRRRILAAAREIIGTQGFDALTMRTLAEAGGVTVPTIYNLVGNKDEVLTAAVAEQNDQFLAGIHRSEGDLLAIIDADARELLRMRDYYRSLVQLLMTNEAAAPARHDVERALHDLLRSALGELAEADAIENWVDLDALQDRIQSQLWIASMQWSQGVIPDARLRDTMVYAISLLMLGVVRGPARKEFEIAARQAQPIKRELRAALLGEPR